MTSPEDWRPEPAARWIAEAVETGNPLGTLPADIAPVDVDAGADIAVAVLAALGISACGVRLLFRPGQPALAGPMIEGRLIPAGGNVATAALRHARVTIAVIGVLADAIEASGDAAPRFAGLHAALDVSSTRFSSDPVEDALLTADLARLGLVVAGRRKPAESGPVSVSLGRKGARRPVSCDLAVAFQAAAEAARSFGGLPAGALLVVAGLTPPVPAEGALSASCGALGRVEANFG